MKKFASLIPALLIFTITGPLFATDSWNNVNPQYFTLQKDVLGNLNTFSHSSGTVFFGGKIYMFVNNDYEGSDSGNDNFITVAKFTNSAPASGFPSWTVSSKDEQPSKLTYLPRGSWQPTPVEFKGTLFLFVNSGIINKEAVKPKYSIYNQSDNSWSDLHDGPPGCNGSYMAAAVIGNNLCLVTNDSNNTNMVISWTTDMLTWKSLKTNIVVGTNNTFINSANRYGISAIAKSYLNNRVLDTKLMVGYIDNSEHAFCAEFSFNGSGELLQNANNLIANDQEYSSVALAEGTVKGQNYTDPASGIVTQAFLKRGSKDDWRHAAYRILRYSKPEGGQWSIAESNLTPVSSPLHMWADDYMNITAINVRVHQDNKDVRQFMCLIYRGYDDFDHPLNIVYAQTDTYKYLNLKTASNSENSLFKTYLGYIEGPPPYYVNKPGPNYADPYFNSTGGRLSSVTFTHKEGVSSQDSLKYTVGINARVEIPGLNFELGEELGQAFNNVTEKEIITKKTFYPDEGVNTGTYICYIPSLHRADYSITDVNSVQLYKTYYFYNTDIFLTNEPAVLQGGLVPGKPETYYGRPVNFGSYPGFGTQSISWAEGTDQEAEIEIETSSSNSFSSKTSLTLGLAYGEIFDIGVSGTLEFETSTTFTTGNAIECSTVLNDAEESTDLDSLSYNFYWLKPSANASINWWIPVGLLQDQAPWCLTYEVTHYHYKDGRSGGAVDLEMPESTGVTESRYSKESVMDAQLPHNIVSNQANTGISLSQNFPNPFSSSTTIRYHVGYVDQPIEEYCNTSHVILEIYNINGSKISTLTDQLQPPGDYEINWDGSGLSNGFYFCTLFVDGRRKVIKILKM